MRAEAAEAAPVEEQGQALAAPPGPAPARSPARGPRRRGPARAAHSTQARRRRAPAPRGRGRVPAHPGELVPTRHGEAPAERLLVLGEDVDAERPGRGDAGPARGGLGRGQGHEGGVERQRGEALAGEADRLARPPCPATTVTPVAKRLMASLNAGRRRPRSVVSEDHGGDPRQAASDLERRRAAARSTAPREHAVSICSSVWEGSWWNRASRFGPPTPRPRERRSPPWSAPIGDLANSSSVYWASCRSRSAPSHSSRTSGSTDEVRGPDGPRRRPGPGRRPRSGSRGYARCGPPDGPSPSCPPMANPVPPRSWNRNDPSNWAMWMGKNGATMEARPLPAAPSWAGPRVDHGLGVAHGGEERKPEHVVIVQVGEQGVGPSGSSGRRRRIEIVAQGEEPSPQINDQGWLTVHLHQTHHCSPRNGDRGLTNTGRSPGHRSR